MTRRVDRDRDYKAKATLAPPSSLTLIFSISEAKDEPN